MLKFIRVPFVFILSHLFFRLKAFLRESCMESRFKLIELFVSPDPLESALSLHQSRRAQSQPHIARFSAPSGVECLKEIN